ncbi:MAG: hypothetical protein ACRD98_10570 [Nitrososphaera sp.]
MLAIPKPDWVKRRRDFFLTDTVISTPSLVFASRLNWPGPAMVEPSSMPLVQGMGRRPLGK